MGRDLSLEDKKRHLAQQSLEAMLEIGSDNRLDENGLPEGFYMNEIFALMEYFQDKRVYVTDMPVFNAPHPEGVNMLVDPAFRGVPMNKACAVRDMMFEDFHAVSDYINGCLDNDEEVFLYTITPTPVMYNPFDFTQVRKPIVRIGNVHMSTWYPNQYDPPQPVQDGVQENRYQRGGQMYNTLGTLKTKDIVIRKRIKRFLFKTK